jgi:hypothetical protein
MADQTESRRWHRNGGAWAKASQFAAGRDYLSERLPWIPAERTGSIVLSTPS